MPSEFRSEPLFEYEERVGLPSLCRLAARPQAAPPKTKVLTKALTRRGRARRQRPWEIRVFLSAAGFLSFASLILMDDLPPLGELFYSAPSSRGRFPPMTWPRTGGAFFEARPRTINSGGFFELGCAAIRAAAKLVRPASERAAGLCCGLSGTLGGAAKRGFRHADRAIAQLCGTALAPQLKGAHAGIPSGNPYLEPGSQTDAASLVQEVERDDLYFRGRILRLPVVMRHRGAMPRTLAVAAIFNFFSSALSSGDFLIEPFSLDGTSFAVGCRWPMGASPTVPR
jgi:hypothetical protein